MGQMKNITGLLYLLLFTVLGMASCGRGNNGVDELPVSEPTVTPIVLAAEIPTFTPTPITVIPEPTSTEAPTLVPTPTPVLNRTKTNVQANLRSGPGVVYSLAGLLEKGTEVVPVSRTADRLWLKLETGDWIFANLVEEAPTNLPVETNIPAPPPPMQRLLLLHRQRCRRQQPLHRQRHLYLCGVTGHCPFTEMKNS